MPLHCASHASHLTDILLTHTGHCWPLCQKGNRHGLPLAIRADYFTDEGSSLLTAAGQQPSRHELYDKLPICHDGKCSQFSHSHSSILSFHSLYSTNLQRFVHSHAAVINHIKVIVFKGWTQTQPVGKIYYGGSKLELVKVES